MIHNVKKGVRLWNLFHGTYVIETKAKFSIKEITKISWQIHKL